MQSIIFSGLQDILTALVGVFVAFLVAYIKQHFSAKQISTAREIATEAVAFAAQTSKRLGVTQDLAKYDSALVKAKDLASKTGINFIDSQWETLLESAYKKAKGELLPLQTVSGTSYTEDDIINMVKAELGKVAPNVPVDMITSLIQQELGKLSVSINFAPVATTETPSAVQEA